MQMQRAFIQRLKHVGFLPEMTRKQKRRKARKEPVKIVELSRLTLEPQTALIIRLPNKAGLGDAAWLDALRAQLPEKATVLVVERSARIEVVQRGRKQNI